MTVWVQFLRAPRWDEEIDAWRVSGNKSTSSPIEFVDVKKDEVPFDKDLELSDGIRGDETAETMEMGINSPQAPRQPTPLSVKKQKGSRTQEAQLKAPIIRKAYTNTKRINSRNVDKSVSADTGKHAVNMSQTSEQATTQGTPGLHMSCVYPDGTKEEVHLPDLQRCCIGILGEITEADEESKPSKEPKASEELGVVSYDEYGLEDTNNPDYLVRRLQMEEEAAAARRAERNMAPVASFEFATKSNNASRRNKGRSGNNTVTNDDVSEMTRGSGFTGVSEILDETKAILDDLER